MGRYRDEYRRSVEDPAGFWGEQARRIDWVRKPANVLDESRPPFYRWFPDGVLTPATTRWTGTWFRGGRTSRR